MKGRVVVIGCCLLVAAGCAGVAPQQVGQVMGSIAGAVIAPGIGAPVGGLIGLLAGTAVQRRVDQVTEQHERVELGRQLKTASTSSAGNGDAPPVGTPTRVWVDETFRDGRLVAGTFEERYIP